MNGFIDSKTIWSIIYDNVDDVKEILETKMRISPFTLLGQRTYYTKYIDTSNEIQTVEIDQDMYSKTYNDIKNNENE